MARGLEHLAASAAASRSAILETCQRPPGSLKGLRYVRSSGAYSPLGAEGWTLGSRGYTFVELLVVATIVMILASAIMPLARVTATRTREAELRRALREMRTAIDKYKDAADLGQIGSLDIKVGSENYPADLQVLVNGVTAANDATGRKLKFLRHVPVDPMTRGTEWGLRSYQDKPDTTRWGGQNVFDVYTTFDGKALDGTKYRDW